MEDTATMVLISAVIKARNEEDQIALAIDSLEGFAGEVIVVDDASEDSTAEIARLHGAHVIQAKSREGMINELDKIGFESAKGNWILRMDADERMTTTLAQKLFSIAVDGRWNGVRFARKNIMFGKWVRYGGWFQSDQLRFFRSEAWDRQWFWADIHSQVPVQGPILTLPAEEAFATLHYDYRSVLQFFHRSIVGYASNEAQVKFSSGVRSSFMRIVIKPIRRFLGRYLIRQGFRDGWHGFILAALLAIYDFAIEAYLWDLERQYRERSEK